ncbi:hypothetical protein ATCC90586_007103 [Pythium insidiosum]|nr:hypothetical protein ATCC90586_007103 [Pythium insidiosum]
MQVNLMHYRQRNRALSKRVRGSPEFFANKITSDANNSSRVRLEFIQHPNIFRPDLLVADILGDGQAVKRIEEKIRRIEQELGSPQLRRGSERYHQSGCSVLLFEGAVSILHRGLEFNVRLSSELQLEKIRTRPYRWFQTTLKMHQELMDDKSRMDDTLDIRYYVSHSEDVPPTDELDEKLRRACDKAPHQRGVLQFLADEKSDCPKVGISAQLVEQGIEPRFDVREFMIPSESLTDGFLRCQDKKEVELVMPPLTAGRIMANRWLGMLRSHVGSAGALAVATSASAGAAWLGAASHCEARAEGADGRSALAIHRTARSDWSQTAHEWHLTSWKPSSPQLLLTRRDVRQHYSVENLLGQGGFGLVHLGRDKRSNARVAIKRVHKHTTAKDKFLQEVNILREMGGRHNIVGLCEAFETSDAYVLVTELVDGEELFEHLVSRGVFTERRARVLIHEITSTLSYLHANHVVHGDIKPENILLSADSSMRLIDFGQSFREHDASERRRCVGSGVSTVAYAAPELLGQSGGAAGSAIDMWALGVVIFILLCGYHPFDPTNDASDNELRQRIIAGQMDKESTEWQALSPDARDLIKRLLVIEPAGRLTAEQVLKHPWLQEMQQQS